MYNIDVDKNKLGISVNSLSISGTNYLTKNATILPSSFTSSSLTSLGVIDNLNIGGLLNVSGNVLNKSNLTISGTLQSPLTNLLSVSVGNSLTRNETTLPSNFINSSLISVGTLTSLNITGNTINNGNLTISGTLQSPMTSLLSVSSNTIDGKVGQQLGITNINLNNASILLGVSVVIQ